MLTFLFSHLFSSCESAHLRLQPAARLALESHVKRSLALSAPAYWAHRHTAAVVAEQAALRAGARESDSEDGEACMRTYQAQLHVLRAASDEKRVRAAASPGR